MAAVNRDSVETWAALVTAARPRVAALRAIEEFGKARANRVDISIFTPGTGGLGESNAREQCLTANV